MKLTATEAHDRIVKAVGDDGTVDEQWGDETSGLWGHYAGYDSYDKTGDLRFYATLKDAAELMQGRAAPVVSSSDGAGSITGDQWFTHLKTIRDQAQADYEGRLKAIKQSVRIAIQEIATYSLTPIIPGSRLADPASPFFLGDPRYGTLPTRRGAREW